MKFNSAIIEKLTFAKSGAAQDIRWDDSLPGFGVRIFPNDAKSFVVTYRIGGRKFIKSLGRFGLISYEQARRIAKIKLGAAMQGEDPMAESDKLRRGKTVKELADDYIREHSKKHKKSWAEDVRRFEKHINPSIGSRKASSITHPDCLKIHSQLSINYSYEANRTLRLLSALFSTLKVWGHADENPCKGIKLNKEKKRKRWVKPAELERLSAALEKEPNTYARFGILLYLLTGVRKNELLKAQWRHVDWDLKPSVSKALTLGGSRDMARPRKEGMDYFPHDTDALNDEKLEKLEAIYGNDGYAFFFKLLERIYRCPTFELDISDPETVSVLAHKVGVPLDHFDTILKSAFKHGCFDREAFEERKVLTSRGIKKRAIIVQEERERQRKRYERRFKTISAPETTRETRQETPGETEGETQQRRVEQNREKKIIEKENSASSVSTSPLALSEPFESRITLDFGASCLAHYKRQLLRQRQIRPANYPEESHEHFVEKWICEDKGTLSGFFRLNGQAPGGTTVLRSWADSHDASQKKTVGVS